MKHIRSGGQTQYAFCAIDPYTKEAVIHIASTPSSSSAKTAIEKVLAKFGTGITIITDHGSENLGKVYHHLKEQNITQLFTRPRTPKDKPYIENFIGKYQKECLNETFGIQLTAEERQVEADRWLDKWHNFRPHQALNYLTPQQFCAKLGLLTKQAKVYTM
jgi:transposase InsO family protein